MFCLGRSCLLTSTIVECEHTVDEKRALTTTWVLDEVQLAVEKGYNVREIYVVYE